MVPVALWRHLWYRSSRKGSGHRVQPHIPQRHWQEVRNAEVLHRTPDRVAYRSTGEDEDLKLHLFTLTVPTFIIRLIKTQFPLGFKIRHEWSSHKWKAPSLLCWHKHVSPVTTCEWISLPDSICKCNMYSAIPLVKTKCLVVVIFTCGRQQCSKPCQVDWKNEEEKGRKGTWWAG